MLAALLGSIWIGYQVPTLWLGIPLLFLQIFGLLNPSSPSASSVSWWVVVIQSVIGFGFSMWIVRAKCAREGRKVLYLLPADGVSAVDTIDFVSALLDAAVFGFIYNQRRPLDSSIPIREIGSLSAVCLTMAAVTLSYVAKQFWFRNRSCEPLSLEWLVELTCLLLGLDLMIWGAKAPTRIGIAAVIGVRYIILGVQYVLFLSNSDNKKKQSLR